MPRDSIGHTLKIAVLLCVTCSVLVSGAAVGLRSAQQRNEQLEMQRNILAAAGLWEPGMNAPEVRQIYDDRVERRVIDLRTGNYTQAVNPTEYNQRRAARDPARSMLLSGEQDVAGIRRREHYSFVYLIRGTDGSFEQIVLPVRGYGLWSVLWGFLSIDLPSLMRGPEHAAIRGITFYEHAETPGLGGEVDNPRWQAQWQGKHPYDENWNVQIQVIKGTVDPEAPQADHRIDGLSGATITANGVTNMMNFWLGEMGFQSFLRNLKEGAAEPQTAAEGGGNG